MNCPDFETLSAYADGEARHEEARRVEGHLPACPDCRVRLEGLRAAKAALAALPAAAMPAELRRSLLDLRTPPLSARRGRTHSPIVRAAFGLRPGTRCRGWVAELIAGLGRPWVALPAAAALGLALFLWTRGLGLFAPRVEIPLDLLLAAHNQYALTLPLAPAEKIMSEMPAELAQGSTEGSDVY